MDGHVELAGTGQSSDDGHLLNGQLSLPADADYAGRGPRHRGPTQIGSGALSRNVKTKRGITRCRTPFQGLAVTPG